MPKGGKRPGAGRNPAEKPKVPYSTRLRQDQAEWLKSQPNAAREIEKALDAYVYFKKGK